MNKHIVDLVNKVQGVGTQEEKVRAVEAYVNKEKQSSYYQLKTRIEKKLREYEQSGIASQLTVTGVISFINDL